MGGNQNGDDVVALLVKPPKTSWSVGAVATGVALAAHLFAHRWANIVGYLFGTVVVIIAVSSYRQENARRSNSPWYSPEPARDKLTGLMLVLGIGAAAVHVWYLSEVSP